ncbi:16S rRNA (guanine(527)-N(7))-methyltransferase RsmG [Nocardioides sp. GY 10127]|uniref:16S rRNA (guanine(527)-N(7))-methyltransferase RsmG n=1 Tax=Nocardioides sp. GY 10127 TaxID=2569762 RepID=UPI00197EC2B4|nr:16S rRNA (guanine(527)-N(7))-methyltransferase RsmG [Nocardioides sp. GY 10127]
MPAEARGVFRIERLPLIERYADILASDGVTRGLIGPREVARLWDRHLLNCGVVAEAVPHGARVADVGSGAGLPGLVLAIARPDLTVTLIEPLLRRTTFLQEVVDELGLDHVTVHRGRADSAVGPEGYDVVTSRAVAGLPRLLEWSMPLVRPSGVLLAMKGSSVEEEIREAEGLFVERGYGPAEVLTVGAEVLAQPTILCRVPWADPGSVAWPPRPQQAAAARSPRDKARRERSNRARRGRRER